MDSQLHISDFKRSLLNFRYFVDHSKMSDKMLTVWVVYIENTSIQMRERVQNTHTQNFSYHIKSSSWRKCSSMALRRLNYSPLTININALLVRFISQWLPTMASIIAN